MHLPHIGKAAIQAVGGYDESTKNCGLENYELILKLLLAGHRGQHIAQPLFAYRRHGMILSQHHRDKSFGYGLVLLVRLQQCR